jgi:hypothetical protein
MCPENDTFFDDRIYGSSSGSSHMYMPPVPDVSPMGCTSERRLCEKDDFRRGPHFGVEQ